MSEHDKTTPEEPSRRAVLSNATSIAVGAGLVASYGTFFYFAGGYLYVGTTSLWVHLRGHLESRRPLLQIA